MISPHIRPPCMLRPSKRKAPLIAVLVVVVVAAAVVAAAGGVTHNVGNDAALLQLAAIAAVAIAPAIAAVPVSIAVVAAVTAVVVAAAPVHSIRMVKEPSFPGALCMSTCIGMHVVLPLTSAQVLTARDMVVLCIIAMVPTVLQNNIYGS